MCIILFYHLTQKIEGSEKFIMLIDWCFQGNIWWALVKKHYKCNLEIILLNCMNGFRYLKRFYYCSWMYQCEDNLFAYWDIMRQKWHIRNARRETKTHTINPPKHESIISMVATMIYPSNTSSNFVFRSPTINLINPLWGFLISIRAY